MGQTDLSTLAAFLAVAEERSFTRAGKRLGVSASAMSHGIRGLEEDLGVRLLSRTTRSVAPTEAGQRLLSRLRPALHDVEDVLAVRVSGDQRAVIVGSPADFKELPKPKAPRDRLKQRYIHLLHGHGGV